MNYLANSFSLNMLREGAVLFFQRCEEKDILYWMKEKSGRTIKSIVGHEDTARLFSRILGIPVKYNRESVMLDVGDELFVGQYRGPRLPEGTTELPVGSKIEWWHITV